MVWAEESITIACSREALFALVSDMPQMPRWRATLLEARWEDAGPTRVGRPLRAVTKVAGRRFDWRCEITEWDPPRMFGYIAKGVGGDTQQVQVRFRIEPVGDASRLTMAGGGELPGSIAGIAAPVFVRMIRRENRKALHELRSLAEEGEAADP
jgi:uncharacterized membrane protein